MGRAVLLLALAAALRFSAADDAEASGGISASKQVDQGLKSAIEISDGDNRLELWEAPTEVRKLAPYYKMGYDADGSPVYAVEFGRWNFKLLSEESEEFQNYFWKYWEQYIQRLLRDGRENKDDGVVLLIDWDGFTLKNYGASEALQMALKLFSDFPRLVLSFKYGIMINTNFAAENFINIARPFLGNVMEKFLVYGTQPEKWKPELLRKIPRDQLPLKYGGRPNYKPLAYDPTK